MARRVEVLQRVCMLRVFATSHVTAYEADTQLCPRRADGDAFLAAAGAWRYIIANLGEMFALLGHCAESLIKNARL
jgi:hypothetical protein